MKRTKTYYFDQEDVYRKVVAHLQSQIYHIVAIDEVIGKVTKVWGHWDIAGRGFIKVTLDDTLLRCPSMTPKSPLVKGRSVNKKCQRH